MLWFGFVLGEEVFVNCLNLYIVQLQSLASQFLWSELSLEGSSLSGWRSAGSSMKMHIKKYMI